MRASLRAIYGIDLREAKRTMRVPDLADLVIWLPPGCALWKDYGGPASLSDEVAALRRIDYTLRVLDYHQRQGKGSKPKPPQDPPFAHERRAAEAAVRRKAEAILNRQRNRG